MNYEMMWVEKYRPKKLGDIIGHDETKSRLKGFIKTKSLPHLLFAGPPGTGKTSAVIAMSREIFGIGNVRGNLLELNASDDRGIDVIRNQVKDFAQTLPVGNAPFKIISLDEADALTSAAQQALRRTMERYHKTSRFVLLCNYPGKIIEPVQSRCAFFRFERLPKNSILERIEQIAKIEKVSFELEGIETIIEACNGDLRKAINILQATNATGFKIDKKRVLDTIGGVDPKEIKNLLTIARNQDFHEAKKKLLDLIFVRGVSGSDLLREINKQIFSLDLSETSKMKVIQLLAEIDFRLIEGASPDIQISSLIAQIGTLD